jgi:hypothetical protein
MLGSLVCALAPNMFVLILGRVLHGLGGGGLTSTGMVVLGDIAAPRDAASTTATSRVLHHRGRLRAGARRRDRRVSALVSDLLDEHPARPDREGLTFTLLRRCRGTTGRTSSTSSVRRCDGVELLVHAGAEHGAA